MHSSFASTPYSNSANNRIPTTSSVSSNALDSNNQVVAFSTAAMIDIGRTIEWIASCRSPQFSEFSFLRHDTTAVGTKCEKNLQLNYHFAVYRRWFCGPMTSSNWLQRMLIPDHVNKYLIGTKLLILWPTTIVNDDFQTHMSSTTTAKIHTHIQSTTSWILKIICWWRLPLRFSLPLLYP